MEAESADIESMTAAAMGDERQPAPVNDARVAPIWLYNIGLIATALVLWVTVLRHLDGHRIVAVGWPWWALGLVFFLAEAYVVHVQFRREAHTI